METKKRLVKREVKKRMKMKIMERNKRFVMRELRKRALKWMGSLVGKVMMI